METVTDSHADGRRTADDLVRLVAAEDTAGAGQLLAGIPTIRELVFVGAGLTAIARSEGRRLPPAQRAQANTRQLRLGLLRDANRTDPDGLRTWLRRAGEEILLIRSQQVIADRVDADAQERTASRAAAEASGTTAASSAPTTT